MVGIVCAIGIGVRVKEWQFMNELEALLTVHGILDL